MSMQVRARQDEWQPQERCEEPKPAKGGKNPANDLSDMLEETRILLPGTQVFAGFLITLPFQSRFEKLTRMQRDLYLIVFVTVILALICFIMPAAYHRVARPVHNKQGFKVLATRVVIVGLIPFSIATVLSTYLIIDVVVSSRFAALVALLVTVPLVLLWWLFPVLRMHDAMATPEEDG